MLEYHASCCRMRQIWQHQGGAAAIEWSGMLVLVGVVLVGVGLTIHSSSQDLGNTFAALIQHALQGADASRATMLPAVTPPLPVMPSRMPLAGVMISVPPLRSDLLLAQLSAGKLAAGGITIVGLFLARAATSRQRHTSWLAHPIVWAVVLGTMILALIAHMIGAMTAATLLVVLTISTLTALMLKLGTIIGLRRTQAFER